MFSFSATEIIFIILFTFLSTVTLLRLLETESQRMERRLHSLIQTTTQTRRSTEEEEESLLRRIYQMFYQALSDFLIEQQRKGRLGSLDSKIKQSGRDMESNEVWTQSFIFASIGLFFGIVSKNIFVIILAPALGAYIPIFRLNQEISKRQEEFRINLPNFLDLAAITFPSTNNIIETFRIVCDEYDNVVAKEFRRVVEELDSGRPKRIVYREFSERVGLKEVTSLIGQIHQAETMGTGLQDTLNIQSRMMRAERKNYIIEKGNRAQLMIFLPAAIFLFIFMATILFPFIAPIVSEFF